MEEKTQVVNKCSCPPALDDLTLLAVIDDEASVEALEHLRKCPYCASRANDFAELQGQLRRRLYRAFCPTSDELAAYQQGLLDSTHRATLASHLAICSHCRQELHLLAETIGSSPLEWSPSSKQLRRVVAEMLVSHPFFPLIFSFDTSPRYLARYYTYCAENIQVTVNVQSMEDQADRIVLWGSLKCAERPDVKSYGLTASLLRGERIITCSMVDESGNFSLDNLQPGNYSLSFRMPDREVVVESLRL